MNIQTDISNVILKTNRLVLRAFCQSDLQDLFDYAKVEGVGEMAGWAHHKTIHDSQIILDKFIDGKYTFAITLDGKVIGSLGLENYDTEQLPELDNLRAKELGYVLSKDHWGKGLMAEAVNEVTKFLFATYDLDVIVCEHFTKNLQSQRVQEKCGFSHYKKVTFHTQTGQDITSWVSLLQKDGKNLL